MSGEKVGPEKLKDMSEEELREASVKWPKSKEELIEIIDALAERNHTYGTCVYAMSIASISAKRYIAHVIGATGFQAGGADLDIIKRARYLDWFKILKYEDLLYPDKWEEIWSEQKDKFAEKAKEKMEENDESEVHSKVWEHWKKLANKEYPREV